MAAAGPRDPKALTQTCPHPIDRPLFHNVWADLVMLHWPVPAAAVQASLPSGLHADVHDGTAWISLVPFVMQGNRLRGTPALPRIGRFAETNVRTYVVDQDGERGVWFYSLDATSLVVTALARLGIGFPYVFSRMDAVIDDEIIAFTTTRRRWGGPQARSHVVVRRRAAAPGRAASHGLDLFLSARWFAHSSRRGRIVRAPVDHQPWVFADAEIEALDDTLVAAAGFQVDGDPLVRVAVEPIVARFAAPEVLDPGAWDA